MVLFSHLQFITCRSHRSSARGDPVTQVPSVLYARNPRPLTEFDKGPFSEEQEQALLDSANTAMKRCIDERLMWFPSRGKSLSLFLLSLYQDITQGFNFGLGLF